ELGREDVQAVEDLEKAQRETRKDEAKAQTPSDLTPGIVKRVHKLYEELGREDIQAVEDLEKAQRETRKDEAKAEPNPEAKAEP
ncbi:MAG: hypothetical protein WCA08_15710, partial [Desulfoferrobacter sp.]